MTLFSAPDYPQFIADGDDRYHNKAAVLHLTAPDYATPQVDSFEAVLPRPQVRLGVDLDCAGHYARCGLIMWLLCEKAGAS